VSDRVLRAAGSPGAFGAAPSGNAVALLIKVGGLVVALAMPFFLDDFWLQAGLFAMAAMVAAIGLTVLVGTAGQLSLGHAFFVGLGAYTYTLLAGEGGEEPAGLGLAPVLALVAAGLVAGLAGAAFSPIAGRLRGIYLGLASLGLVFLGRHVWVNAEALTGGYNGRPVEPFAVPGFSFSNRDPDFLAVLGVEFEGLHRQWFLFVGVVLVAGWFAAGVVRGRAGRALAAVRDSEVAAGATGVAVARAKATAFTLSSVYAGIGGALTALAFGRVAPDAFGLTLSVDFLVMIVLGGVGSVAGAAAGAAVVVLLPLVLTQYSGALPFLSAPGSGGLDPATLSRLLYGAAIVAVLLFLRGGLAGGLGRLRRRPPPGAPAESDTAPDAPRSKETVA
jgi:branched-chain amino acid transport system permease protein